MESESDLNTTLTGIAVSLGKIHTKLETNIILTEKIATAVYGTNGDGLKTKVALNRSSINRAWVWLAGVSICILGIAGYVIKMGLLKG